MGKYSLGTAKIDLDPRMSKDRFFVDSEKSELLEKRIEENLEKVRISLFNINNLLNRSVNAGVVKGMRAKTFRAWAKKAKSQSENADLLSERLSESYFDDVLDYPIKQLEERISILEKEIAELKGNKGE